MSKTALMFAGQGAQAVGMGRDLAAQFPAARALFDRANAVLGYDLAGICFNGPESELTKTENAQPGIYLVGWVAFQLLQEQVPGFRFDAACGLSLGEFTALAAAGALTFEDGLRLVRARGCFMQESCDAARGGMLAVIGLDEGPTRAVCQEAGIQVANLNCPGQIVVSGPADRLPQAMERLQAAGARKVMPLSVAGAYHSPLMAGAQPKLAAALAAVAIEPTRVPVFSNVTAEPHGGPEEVRARLVEQVTAPVRWEESIRRLLAQGYTRFIELGPGRALNGFLRRIDKAALGLSVGDRPSLQETVKALGS